MEGKQRYRQLHKFGGKCLTDLAHFQQINHHLDPDTPQLIIVSAIGKTTQHLQALLEAAVQGNHYQKALQKLIDFHIQLVRNVLKQPAAYIAGLEADHQVLLEMLNTVHELSSYDQVIKAYVLSMGEFWSSHLFMDFWPHETSLLDPTKVLLVEEQQPFLNVKWQQSHQHIVNFLKNTDANHLVIPGFIARNAEHQRVTLGFEGSDFSAVIFGKLFEVERIYIWKDVAGIYSADPALVKAATVIRTLSYQEALELSYFGASVLHPQAIQPAMSANIPIYIGHAFEPNLAPTVISATPAPRSHPVTGITAIENVSLLNIEGSGMMGISGMAAKIFELLSRAHISVQLISQASSEQSICFVIKTLDLELALHTLQTGLKHEMQSDHIQSIQHKNNCAIVAIVGDGMVGQPGISAMLMNSLAKANINIEALSQGSSERNISVVIDADHMLKAINIIHAGFYLSNRVLRIVLLGAGNVGGVLLQQLLSNQKRIAESHHVELQIAALCNSRNMLLEPAELSVDNYQAKLADATMAFNFDALCSTLKAQDNSYTVVVDCSASELVTDHYLQFIESGFHIVTPNKKAASGDRQRLQKIQQACLDNKRHYLYETNVCAGLPVIKTLQDLIATGDEIETIQGVFSGTLSYLFNELSAGKLFSQALNDAYQNGLTEPDPRDDLNGMDVARKCVCLARELGLDISLEEVDIQAILPESFMTGSIESFWDKLSEMDSCFEQQRQMIEQHNVKFAYLATIEPCGKIVIKLEALESDSPFYQLKGTDNMVVFKTQRYHDFPLVIQGPGAGADVTAAGVFADILRLVDLTLGIA